ncbi:MAG: InlB B-repeat-containing protein, partial [Defluviitaleaceae bacterium]|nr:InlB B-repeat-containing protein [Defluviitaleaceae bacterium]
MKSKFIKSLCVLLSFIMAFSTVTTLAFASEISEISDFSDFSEYATDAENVLDYADYTDYTDYGEDADYADYIGIEPYMGINVTFNANGGSLLPGNTSRQTMANNTIGAGNMPISPTRGGFVFVHWNTAPGGGGTVFTGTTHVSAPITVYAQWGFEVRFYGNGAELTAGTDPNLPGHFLPRNVMANSTANATPGIVWPMNPSRPGFIFQGWFNTYTPTGGTQFTGATQINSSVALFARWTPAPTHTVTFNPAGGSITSPHTATRQVPGGANINQAWALGHNTAATWPRTAPLATRPNMTLEGWWTGLNGTGTRWAPPGAQHTGASTGTTGAIPSGSAGFSNAVVNGPVTVNAHWVYRVLFHTTATGTPSMALARDIPIGVAGATINTHGRAIPAPASIVQGALSGMPANPTQPGATFMGWFLADSFAAAQTGGTPFTGATVITSNTTVWARWQTAAPATVTFQANGGTFPAGGGTVQTRSVAIGATLGSANMPAPPTRAGHIFMGWHVAGQYPQQGVQNRFTNNTTVTAPITVYARWSPYVTVTFRTTAQGTTTDVTRNFPPGFTFNHMDNVWIGAVSGDPNHFWLGNSALRRSMPAAFSYIGWSTEPGGGGSRFTADTVVTGNITVHSAWTIPITFNNNHPAAGAETVQRRVAYGESVT